MFRFQTQTLQYLILIHISVRLRNVKPKRSNTMKTQQNERIHDELHHRKNKKRRIETGNQNIRHCKLYRIVTIHMARYIQRIGRQKHKVSKRNYNEYL